MRETSIKVIKKQDQIAHNVEVEEESFTSNLSPETDFRPRQTAASVIQGWVDDHREKTIQDRKKSVTKFFPSKSPLLRRASEIV